MIKKYIKTTPVEAIQVTQYNFVDVMKFASNQNIKFNQLEVFHTIETLEGCMKFKTSDYIIKNPTGECYVCKKEIFEETYKLLED